MKITRIDVEFDRDEFILGLPAAPGTTIMATLNLLRSLRTVEVPPIMETAYDSQIDNKYKVRLDFTKSVVTEGAVNARDIVSSSGGSSTED